MNLEKRLQQIESAIAGETSTIIQDLRDIDIERELQEMLGEVDIEREGDTFCKRN